MVPFSVETFGRWGTEELEWLRRSQAQECNRATCAPGFT